MLTVQMAGPDFKAHANRFAIQSIKLENEGVAVRGVDSGDKQTLRNPRASLLLRRMGVYLSDAFEGRLAQASVEGTDHGFVTTGVVTTGVVTTGVVTTGVATTSRLSLLL